MRVALFLLLWGFVWSSAPFSGAEELQRMSWMVGEDTREALVWVPKEAKESPTPLVFFWHGHGGTSDHAARAYSFHNHWKEAIVVYPQGLKTPGQLLDQEGKMPGWQVRVGDQNDRDLTFFDTMLESLQSDFKIDENRIYSSGHSNGGQFTYILWAARGDKFAAFAPSGAVFSRDFRNAKPKPVLHVAGETDDRVKFSWQEFALRRVRQLNGCDEAGKESGKYCTEYSSKNGPPVVALIHPGGHRDFPEGTFERIAQFFKEHKSGD